MFSSGGCCEPAVVKCRARTECGEGAWSINCTCAAWRNPISHLANVNRLRRAAPVARMPDVIWRKRSLQGTYRHQEQRPGEVKERLQNPQLALQVICSLKGVLIGGNIGNFVVGPLPWTQSFGCNGSECEYFTEYGLRWLQRNCFYSSMVPIITKFCCMEMNLKFYWNFILKRRSERLLDV